MNHYSFAFTGKHGLETGTVKGVDLRHAAVHFLTSEKGLVHVKDHSIPVYALDAFPANFEAHINHCESTWSLELTKIEG